MPQFCQTNKAAALQQLLFSVNSTVENHDDDGEVDLNDADIEVRQDNMLAVKPAENTTSSSMSVHGARSCKPGQRGRSIRNMPNFMKKTVSSQLK